jgi:hypothetical protein
MIEFGFIGWCNEDNHDKVWGYFLRATGAEPWPGQTVTRDDGWNCCIFWGRRGKAMQFKADVTGYELKKLSQSKLKKGYNKITSERLLEIWPTFIEEAEGKLMWEILAGKVK